MNAPAKEPQVKGTAIRGTLRAIERLCPPGTLRKMIPLLPGQIAPAVEHDAFIAAGWYPLAHVRAIFGAAMTATGRDLELVREISRESTRDDFRGIYRLLAAVISPEFIMRRGPGIFSRYYDTGTLEVTARAGYCEGHYRGCVGFDRVLWADLLAGSATILEVCGARELKFEITRGGGDGDVDCDVVGEWR
ncbi:MAG TPA: hypothetical protein VF997_04985 [Polyangia bacterium]